MPGPADLFPLVDLGGPVKGAYALSLKNTIWPFHGTPVVTNQPRRAVTLALLLAELVPGKMPRRASVPTAW